MTFNKLITIQALVIAATLATTLVPANAKGHTRWMEIPTTNAGVKSMPHQHPKSPTNVAQCRLTTKAAIRC